MMLILNYAAMIRYYNHAELLDLKLTLRLKMTKLEGNKLEKRRSRKSVFALRKF